jgi:hypothetical protein
MPRIFAMLSALPGRAATIKVIDAVGLSRSDRRVSGAGKV